MEPTQYCKQNNLELQVEESNSSDFVKLRLVNVMTRKVEARKVVSKKDFTLSTHSSDLCLVHYMDKR